MPRRLSAWFVALPLMAAGTYLSHCYALAAVDPSTHAAAHHTGHASRTSAVEFFFSAPFLLASLAVLVLALVFRAALSFRGHGVVRMPAWPFAIVPALGFFLHQHFEQLASTGTISAAALTAPAFLLGLVLQLPFGLVAFALVKTLLRYATRIGTALAELRRPRRVPAVSRKPAFWFETAALRLALLSRSAAPRAPPLSFQSR